MIAEFSILAAVYVVWILSLVYGMVASEEVSLTIATLPFIISFPISLICAASLEVIMPGILLADFTLAAVVAVLLSVRWIMAIIGE
ncbi:MAG: hypothetical protein GF309_15315 [Candidatus Lokiarchaeota archaeon]|nr:hypothetical protein [Candidatus Lokiarchaeota archaeon]